MTSRALLFALVLAATPAAAHAAQPVPWTSAVLHQTNDWYAGAEARRIADSVLLHQSPEGGWPKNVSLATPPGPEAVDPGAMNTFDNNAVALPMAFLARVVQATGDDGYRAAFERGLDYTLAAQYPNGGWPQYFPLKGGYHDHITFNDDAMVRTLRMLRDVAAGKAPYAFVDQARRGRAAQAVTKGIDLILRTQVRQDGELTAWCAQYDAELKPAWARRFEPPSLSGSESVGIVGFLMSLDDPSPEVIAAIEGAVAWFRASAIRDARIETFTDAQGRQDRRLARVPGAGPIWARFYELGTNRPIFLGRDSVVRYDVAEIEHERRNGYSYYGTWPADLLAEDYSAWKAAHAPAS